MPTKISQHHAITNFTRPVSISNSHPSQKTRTHSPHKVIAKATLHSKLPYQFFSFLLKKKKKKIEKEKEKEKEDGSSLLIEIRASLFPLH